MMAEGGAPNETRPEVAPRRMASMKPLKEAMDAFPLNHPLRLLIMSEPDEMTAEEYAAKAPMWMKLMKYRTG